MFSVRAQRRSAHRTGLEKSLRIVLQKLEKSANHGADTRHNEQLLEVDNKLQTCQAVM